MDGPTYLLALEAASSGLKLSASDTSVSRTHGYLLLAARWEQIGPSVCVVLLVLRGCSDMTIDDGGGWNGGANAKWKGLER
jgi:hypothetical protein